MKIIIEDLWCDGVHYDRVELCAKDIDENASKDDAIKAITDAFFGD